ncbi:MAG: diguanylate cyclase [Cyanobacteria bacterium P01_F01_bin.150]
MREMISSDINNMVKFAEQLIFDQTKIYCSELQQNLLVSVLQGERKNYDQIAEECGYSVTYIRQDIAPKLWQTFSQALDQRVTKANVKIILEKELRRQQLTIPVSKSPPQSIPDLSIRQTEPDSTANEFQFTTPTMPEAVVKSLKLTDMSTLGLATAGEDSSILQKSSPANILLVDDQPQNLRLLADLLEEQGYEVQEAINGPIALQAVSVELPDLILLDIHMPEMDGYTVCQSLKANPKTKDIPVIFVSAVDEVWDKVKAFSVGGVDYITKPFKVVEVLARVKNQLMVQQLQKSLMIQNAQLMALQAELKAQNAQLQQAGQELQRLAVIDHITRVASRYRFDQYLQSAWQKAMQSDSALSLMLCHLDDFETYNQRYGYQAGDHCLQQVAQTIKRVAQRPEDLVCRYGGEIFAIILPNLEESACETVARTILANISSLRIYQSDSATDKSTESSVSSLKYSSLTTSIGLASVSPTPGMGLEGLVEKCDRALQKAKIQGGNTLVRASTLS